MEANHDTLSDLPEAVKLCLTDFTEAARAACGSNLSALVLYGSAAEGRLRATSDVNIILVFKQFEAAQIDPLRERLRAAQAQIRMSAMFLCESEIPLAAEAFAVKFSDILSRHRVLLGSDPFLGLQVSRAAAIRRLHQVLINLMLRMRERYALVSLREEQLPAVIADAAGPLRACSATLLGLEGKPRVNPKEALQLIANESAGRDWKAMLDGLSAARELRPLSKGAAGPVLLATIDMIQLLLKRAQDLK